MTPDSDYKIHRNQHDFPEEEKQEEIERGEDTDNPSKSPEQIEIEESGSLSNLIPCRANCNNP